MSIVEWFLTQSIYGIIILILPIYGGAYLFKNFFPRFPSPFAVAAVCFILLIATVPSYPRYKFEKQVLSIMEENLHIKVIARANYGDFTEPLTWFRTPLGFVHLVAPNHWTDGGGFRRVLMRYDEETEVTIEDPDCKNLTIMVSAPDNKGVFRHTTKRRSPMSKEDKRLFCDTDWSSEHEKLRELMLKAADKKSK